MDIPSEMSWFDKTATNGDDISYLFASYFKSIYTSDNAFPNYYADETQNSKDADISELSITFNNVFQQLTSLKVIKGSGPDGVPNLFLRNSAAGLCEPITHIFSASLQSGVFPSTW